MPIENAEALLKELLHATTSDAVRTILDEIGDHANVELDEPFGKFQFAWHAFGNNPSNLSSIGLATKPGRSLTERLTNAMDAILEDRAPSGLALMPHSAREAAQQWFGRPITGPEDGLFNWNFSGQDIDRRTSVVLCVSGKPAPTVDVIDDGIGIRPEEFPGTILSLQSGNKITKWYVIGAFGQGGASTLTFCDYAIIVSRHRSQPRVVGFTIVRVLKLSAQYKVDCYGYLCIRDPSGAISVPSCQLNEEPLRLYAHEGTRIPSLHKGTLVRHVSFNLPKLEGPLVPTPGNLYHYLHCSAFDPLLPFRLIDLRGDEGKNEIVTGSRNRLMKLARSASPAQSDETGSQMRYHREMEYFAPHGTQDPSIGIEYWVVFNYRKGRGSQREQLVLRPNSNELYLQTGHPIIGTLNGQNQGELTAQLFREIGLAMVSRHIVVHIDAAKADSRVQRELFSTNREGFKEGPVLTSLVTLLRKMLEEDQQLFEIERELTEKFARREAHTTREEVKRQVAKLLQEAGLQVKQEGPSSAPGGQDPSIVQRSRKSRPQKASPLPTLPFPEVTKFSIVTPRPKMTVRINDSEVVLVETDADSEFDRRGLLGIRSEPSCLELAGKSPLRGGRARWRLRPRPTAKSGDVGRLIVTITKPDGTQLADAIDFEILAALEDKTKKARGYVPPFDIIPINPDDNPEEWALAWPTLAEDPVNEHQAAVAYKPVRVGGGITVYYSTIFSPYKEQVEKLKNESQALSELFRTNYEVWIGYHAILQENNRNERSDQIEDEVMDRILEADRVRVARMQVKQAKETAELMRRLLKEQDVGTT